MQVGISSKVERSATRLVEALLSEEPAILLEGPRGSGKSTLLRDVAASLGGRVLDLDDDAVLAAVLQDPGTAVMSPGLTLIDEFQRAPAVLSVVKRVVDREGGPGRFLLAGSVSAPLLPTGTETLTGRVHRMLLPPLSAGEVLDGSEPLLSVLRDRPDPPPVTSALSRPDYFALVCAGGYPAALARPTPSARQRWFASYLASVADRDLPQVVDIRHPGALPRLYRHLSQNTSTVVGRSALGDVLGLSAITGRAYLDLLVHVHLIHELPGWTAGISAKAGRRPKLHVTDTGLAAASLGMDARRLAASDVAGLFLESFVLSELTKQTAVIDEPLALAHFRDRSGIEVDIVVERADGTVIAVEVKSATSVNQADGKGLRFLRDRLGDRFRCGLLLHTGPLTSRLGDRLWALPVSGLWQTSGP